MTEMHTNTEIELHEEQLGDVNGGVICEGCLANLHTVRSAATQAISQGEIALNSKVGALTVNYADKYTNAHLNTLDKAFAEVKQHHPDAFASTSAVPEAPSSPKVKGCCVFFK